MLDALSDSKGCLSSSIPTLNTRMTQHLTERSCRFLKSASEVPRLYRRTNKVSKVEYTHMFLLLFSVYFVTCLPWRSKGQKDCSAIFFLLGFSFYILKCVCFQNGCTVFDVLNPTCLSSKFKDSTVLFSFSVLDTKHFFVSMFCIRNVSFSNRKLQHEPQPTWTTPYSLCIN